LLGKYGWEEQAVAMEKLETIELLSAYVCGDISADERAAVEALLAAEPRARELESELRKLLVTLKAGEKPLKAALLAALRERIKSGTAEWARTQNLAALLSASLSDDLAGREREQLKQHLAQSSKAAAELQSLRALSSALKAGELPVSAAMSQKLMERLNAKLPASAKVGRVLREPVGAAAQATAPAGATRETPPAENVRTAPAKSGAAISGERPSLRVYAAPENHWPARLAWGGAAIAAMVALAFGVAHLNQPQKTGTEIVQNADTTPPVTENKNVAQETPAPKQNTEVAIKPKSVDIPAPAVAEQKTPAPVAPQPAVAHETRKTPAAVEQPAPEIVKAPAPEVVQNQPAAERNAVAGQNVRQTQKFPRAHEPIAGNVEIPIAPIPNTSVAVAPEKTQTTPEKTQTAPEKTATLPEITTGTRPEVADNTPRTSGSSGGIGFTAAMAQQQKIASNDRPANTPRTNAASAATPVEGAAVVVATKDGLAEANTVILKAGEKIASGSTISTHDSRLSLLLPGDGRLWINSKSILTLSLNGRNTSITLKAGEISYLAPNGGTLTLTAGNAVVREARSVDVKIENNNQMSVCVLADKATLTVNRKNTLLLSGAKGIAALNGSEAAQKSQFTGQPDSWRNDLDASLANDQENAAPKSAPRGKKK